MCVMKKLPLLITVIIIGGLMSFSSCMLDEDCMSCYWEKRDDNTNAIVDQGSPSIYCDDALDEILNESPITVGNLTTRWICK